MSTAWLAIYLLFPCALLAWFYTYVYSPPTTRSPNGLDTEASVVPVYGLSHAILNIQVPTETMWMNMGYWRGQTKPIEFPRACRALLHEVIRQSRIGQDPINLLDVGFGCGDQTIEVLTGCHNGPSAQKVLQLHKYVGITNNKKQFLYAQQRLQALGMLSNDYASRDDQCTQIFLADAAQPNTWSTDLTAATTGLVESDVTTWLLGLDTLYHFTPSRLDLLKHAKQELGACFMSFDLLLGEMPISASQFLLLRLVCLLTAAPFANFMTQAQYKAMLNAAGYDGSKVQFVDISEDVFSPLADFLDHQNIMLKFIGKGIGPFHVAKWMFRWWARSGIVRGCIVVAR